MKFVQLCVLDHRIRNGIINILLRTIGPNALSWRSSECTVTYMIAKRSTSQERRPIVVDAAITAFARDGYRGTTVADVAAGANISPAYVFKLFSGKEQLFVGALDACFERIVDALAQGANRSDGQSPEDILDAMGGAYAELIADRDLLMLQVHAQSAVTVPEIAEALRRGYELVTQYASNRSGATDADVQRFIAFGQLCHLVVTLELDPQASGWAGILAGGLRHPMISNAASETRTDHPTTHSDSSGGEVSL